MALNICYFLSKKNIIPFLCGDIGFIRFAHKTNVPLMHDSTKKVVINSRGIVSFLSSFPQIIECVKYTVVTAC